MRHQLPVDQDTEWETQVGLSVEESVSPPAGDFVTAVGLKLEGLQEIMVIIGGLLHPSSPAVNPSLLLMDCVIRRTAIAASLQNVTSF